MRESINMEAKIISELLHSIKDYIEDTGIKASFKEVNDLYYGDVLVLKFEYMGYMIVHQVSIKLLYMIRDLDEILYEIYQKIDSLKSHAVL